VMIDSLGFVVLDEEEDGGNPLQAGEQLHGGRSTLRVSRLARA
jgi:hypothetical protein